MKKLIRENEMSPWRFLRRYGNREALTKYHGHDEFDTDDELAEELAKIKELTGKRKMAPEHLPRLEVIDEAEFVAWLKATPAEQWPAWIDREKPMVAEILEPGTLEKRIEQIRSRLIATTTEYEQARKAMDRMMYEIFDALGVEIPECAVPVEVHMLVKGAEKMLESRR